MPDRGSHQGLYRNGIVAACASGQKVVAAERLLSCAGGGFDRLEVTM